MFQTTNQSWLFMIFHDQECIPTSHALFVSLTSSSNCQMFQPRNFPRQYFSSESCIQISLVLLNVYPLGMNMTIEIVDFPIKHGDFPWLCQSLPEGKSRKMILVKLHQWITMILSTTPCCNSKPCHKLGFIDRRSFWHSHGYRGWIVYIRHFALT